MLPLTPYGIEKRRNNIIYVKSEANYEVPISIQALSSSLCRLDINKAPLESKLGISP
jgi:hypothetical protein